MLELTTVRQAFSRLVFMGVDGLDRTIHIKIVIELSINQTIGVLDIDHDPSWIDSIMDFVTNGNLPDDP